MDRRLLVVAALADLTGVVVHGVIGYRIMISPLRDRLFATSAFGDEDMSWRIYLTTWHLITAVFACSSVAFLLLALGRLSGSVLPRALGTLHLAFVVTAGAILGGRILGALRRPVAIAFGVCMTTAGVLGWLV